MKITIKDNKLVPFEKIAEGTVFKVLETEDYCIKIVPVANENTDEEEWNCLHLDNYTLECCSQRLMVYPVHGAELIIP